MNLYWNLGMNSHWNFYSSKWWWQASAKRNTKSRWESYWPWWNWNPPPNFGTTGANFLCNADGIGVRKREIANCCSRLQKDKIRSTCTSNIFRHGYCKTDTKWPTSGRRSWQLKCWTTNKFRKRHKIESRGKANRVRTTKSYKCW